MGSDVIRTEHAGAKNGGGYWGPRQDAKDMSRKKRRSDGRQIERHAMEMDSWPRGKAAVLKTVQE